MFSGNSQQFVSQSYYGMLDYIREVRPLKFQMGNGRKCIFSVPASFLQRLLRAAQGFVERNREPMDTISIQFTVNNALSQYHREGEEGDYYPREGERPIFDY